MTFIPTLAQARQIVASNPAFQMSETTVGDIRLHDFGYLLPGYMDFEDPVPGSGMKAHELRGLTFVEYPDGTVTRHLLLRKFHALNQTTGHMLKDVVGKPGKRIVSVSEKLDGSVIRFIPVGDKLVARSKGSFSGVHCRLAMKLLVETPGLEAFVREAHSRDMAPVFELISPTWAIVVPYPVEELRLIQMRGETDGGYVDIASDESVLRHGPRTSIVPGIETIEQVVALQESERGVEGWVVMFEDGTLMKCKTRWYDDFHDFFFEKIRTDKKMVSMVLGETMDDALASMAADDPSRDAAEEISALVGDYVNAISREVSDAVAGFGGDTGDNAARKAFTQKHAGNPLIGLFMQSLKDPSPAVILGLAKRFVANMAKREEDAAKLLTQLGRVPRHATATETTVAPATL